MFEPERIRHLNEKPATQGDYVLYWMQASQRTRYNHALEYAIYQANHLSKPLVVFFGLTPSFPDANLRHYHFMLNGLSEVASELKKRSIKFVLQPISPDEGALKLSKNACMVITDMGYLRIQRQWRTNLAKKAKCPVIQVESDVIVPVATASNKREYAARTIRPKITKLLEQFLRPVKTLDAKKDSAKISFESLDLLNIDAILANFDIDKTVTATNYYKSGQQAAKKTLDTFISKKLVNYENDRNDPAIDGLSNLSPYLHFGQISPLEIALKVKTQKFQSADAFLEELIIRRELSMNFTHFTENYDNYLCLPGWAKTTLANHKSDKRPYVYTLDELENAQTHDDCWNGAQRQMVITGKMHGYMRMYWGKKIIEWTKTPQTAFKWMLYLNNKYELDGRDPNGFCGVAWCFGNHDRPWGEREIFGQIRYMNQAGLKRKFDTLKYIKIVNSLK